MEPVIETGLPVPPSNAGKSRARFRPMIVACLERLSIGDNVLWPETTYDARNSVAEAATRTAKRTGREFTVRLTEGGVRCWRLA